MVTIWIGGLRCDKKVLTTEVNADNPSPSATERKVMDGIDESSTFETEARTSG